MSSISLSQKELVSSYCVNGTVWNSGALIWTPALLGHLSERVAKSAIIFIINTAAF